MAKGKSWGEKLQEARDLPKVVALKENARKHWRGGTMAIRFWNAITYGPNISRDRCPLCLISHHIAPFRLN
jgi:hypothetical protein